MRKKTFVSLALMLSVIMLVFTSVPTFASGVPSDKYTYSLSGEVGTQSKKIDIEEFDDNEQFIDILKQENYKIVLVKEGAEIKFTPKETMPAIVNYYLEDGMYAGPLEWTIDGSEKMVSKVDANKTATTTLHKRYGGFTCDIYYVFSFGDANKTNIIYKVSDDSDVSTTKPAESTEAAESTESTTKPAVKPLATTIAKATVSKVLVDGKQVPFEAYNINNSNYFKLRDIAMAVNGTDKSFEVGFDKENNAISLLSDEAYTAHGGELAVSADLKDKKATLSTAKVYLDDEEIQLTAYTIGGNNYFKLSDLADQLGITITFDAKTNTIGIVTTSAE